MTPVAFLKLNCAGTGYRYFWLAETLRLSDREVDQHLPDPLPLHSDEAPIGSGFGSGEPCVAYSASRIDSATIIAACGAYWPGEVDEFGRAGLFAWQGFVLQAPDLDQDIQAISNRLVRLVTCYQNRFKDIGTLVARIASTRGDVSQVVDTLALCSGQTGNADSDPLTAHMVHNFVQVNSHVPTRSNLHVRLPLSSTMAIPCLITLLVKGRTDRIAGGTIASVEGCSFVSLVDDIEGYTDFDATPLLLPVDGLPVVGQENRSRRRGGMANFHTARTRTLIGTTGLIAVSLVLMDPSPADRVSDNLPQPRSLQLQTSFTSGTGPLLASGTTRLPWGDDPVQIAVDSVLASKPYGLSDADSIRRSLQAQFSTYRGAAEFLYGDSILRVQSLGTPFRVPFSFSRSPSPIKWLLNRPDVPIPAGVQGQIETDINSVGISKISPGLVIYRGPHAKLYVADAEPISPWAGLP